MGVGEGFLFYTALNILLFVNQLLRSIHYMFLLLQKSLFLECPSFTFVLSIYYLEK